MRKVISSMLLGATLIGGLVSATAARADDDDDRRERWEDRRDDDDDDDDRRDRRWDDRRDGRWDNRRDDRWDDRRGNDWRRYGYDYRGARWNQAWTPWGFGYNDRYTRDWVVRNFADRNRNGRVSEREWRRAQASFYRFADRDRNGRLSRGEYDYAVRYIRGGQAYRW